MREALRTTAGRSLRRRIVAAGPETVLAVVALLLWLEHRAQHRMRFSTLRGMRAGSSEAQPAQLHGAGGRPVAAAAHVLRVAHPEAG